MGQIVSAAAKPKRCNLNQLSQVPTPAAGEYILVSSDNSMTADGQGNFDAYVEGDGVKAAKMLKLHYLKDVDDLLKLSIYREKTELSFTEANGYVYQASISGTSAASWVQHQYAITKGQEILISADLKMQASSTDVAAVVLCESWTLNGKAVVLQETATKNFTYYVKAPFDGLISILYSVSGTIKASNVSVAVLGNYIDYNPLMALPQEVEGIKRLLGEVKCEVEIGSLTINSSGWIKVESNTRLRMLETNLSAGSTISVASGYMIYVGYKDENGYGNSGGWIVGNTYTCPVDGIYVLTMSSQDGSVVWSDASQFFDYVEVVDNNVLQSTRNIDTINKNYDALSDEINALKVLDINKTMFESGLQINISTSGWTYVQNSYFVSSKSGVTLHLLKGDIISTDFENIKLYIGWLNSNNAYKMQGWLTSEYIVTEEGDYVITMTQNGQSPRLVELDYYYNSLTIKRNYVTDTLSDLGKYAETYRSGELKYYGKKINLNITRDNQNGCTRETIFSATYGEYPEIRYNQSMAIYDGVAFCFINNNLNVYAIDVVGGTILSTFTLGDSSLLCHMNNAQFLDVFADSSDRFPLLLLSRGDYGGADADKFYVLRIVESESNVFSATIWKTLNCTMTQATYNGSWVADVRKKRLFLYTWTLGSWQSETEGNQAVIYEFAQPNWSSRDSVTITSDDVVGTSLFPYLIWQGADFCNGLLIMPLQRTSYINGELMSTDNNGHAIYNHNNNWIFFINPDNGVVEHAVPWTGPLYTWEPEGVAVYNNALYVSLVFNAQNDTDECFRIFKYTF